MNDVLSFHTVFNRVSDLTFSLRFPLKLSSFSPVETTGALQVFSDRQRVPRRQLFSKARIFPTLHHAHSIGFVLFRRVMMAV